MNSFKKHITSKSNKIFFKILGIIIIVFSASFIFYQSNKSKTKDNFYVNEDIDRSLNDTEKGIHVPTGLIDAEGLNVVIANCTGCHSAKLITQNRLSRNQWNATINWMQETQNLWDLDVNRKVIVDYLVTNYPQNEMGRRENLINIKWYLLKE